MGLFDGGAADVMGLAEDMVEEREGGGGGEGGGRKGGREDFQAEGRGRWAESEKLSR